MKSIGAIPTHQQAQAMVGILALEDQSCAANIRTLHYRWRSAYVAPTAIYCTLWNLRDKGWVRSSRRRVMLMDFERQYTCPVYRLTEAGRRALTMYYADTLWIGAANHRAYRSIISEAQAIVNRIVDRARELSRAA